MTALLLTGLPGVGKTTVLESVAASLPAGAVRGFLTRELRAGRRRTGFRIESLTGPHAVLAHVDLDSPRRVGRYGVDVAALERIVDAALDPADPVAIHLVDEIGRMECYSQKFVATVEALLDRGRPLVATVARRGGGFIAGVKHRPDVTVWEVTRRNRDGLPARVLEFLDS